MLSPLRVAGSLVAAVVVVLVALSPSLGRAAPVGSYRPALPPDALTNGCWPLPGGVVLPFPYVVRRDQVVGTPSGPRRVLLVHVDEVGPHVALRRLLARLVDAGVDGVSGAAGRFAGTGDGDLVRGWVRLSLPPSAPDRSRPECREPFSTKDFPPSYEDRS